MAGRLARLLGRRGSSSGTLARWLRTLRRDPSRLDPLATDDRPGEAFEASWRRLVKARVLVTVAVLGCWVVVIQGRLVQLQVFQHEWLTEKALAQQQREIPLEGPRGDIFDRNGQILAWSVQAYGVFAEPKLIEDPEKTAAALCRAFGDCSAQERRELPRKLRGEGRYVPLRKPHEVAPWQVDEVRKLGFRGIGIERGSRRYYPRKELAAQVLGFAGAEHQGQAGVEYTFNRVVGGTAGKAIAHVDARRQVLEMRVEREPVPGADLELTLDLRIQHILERELERGVRENGALGGSAVAVNPTTGEVLGMASYPTFDPNRPGNVPAARRRNPAVEDTYEPGSTFKIVTAAAALEYGIVRPTDPIDCGPGIISLPGGRIVDEAGGKNYGVLSFEDVIVRSSNVGAIRVGLSTTAPRLAEYVERFGFGQRSTRELPGITPGQWSPRGLDIGGVASVSMGYQVGVTPLQMVMAASVVANGGLLMQPRFVRAVIRDGRREVRQPELIRRVIEPHTAATLTAIMEAVVERGTARAAQLDGYQVAGKTGTTQKVMPDGGYSQTDHVASFVGFVPSRRPALTILVVIDTPRTRGHYGGGVAAPIFQRIADGALRQLGVPPTIDPIPPVLRTDGRTAPVARPGRPEIIRTSALMEGSQALVPDVRGLSARAALRVLARAGLTPRVEGTGVVVNQTPEPGAPVEAGASGVLRLERRSQRADREDGR
jgi:cell division protein FtsI/penicillin-binding protein 2